MAMSHVSHLLPLSLYIVSVFLGPGSDACSLTVYPCSYCSSLPSVVPVYILVTQQKAANSWVELHSCCRHLGWSSLSTPHSLPPAGRYKLNELNETSWALHPLWDPPKTIKAPVDHLASASSYYRLEVRVGHHLVPQPCWFSFDSPEPVVPPAWNSLKHRKNLWNFVKYLFQQ